MYCAVDPALGLVTMSDAARSHPKLSGMLSQQSSPCYTGQSPSSMPMDVQQIAYRTYRQYHTAVTHGMGLNQWSNAAFGPFYVMQSQHKGEGDIFTHSFIPGGIPLKTFINEDIEGRGNSAFNFCNQYREAVGFLTEASTSPTSSGYASSSGRSSESTCEVSTSESERLCENQAPLGSYTQLEHKSLDEDTVRPRSRSSKPTRKVVTRAQVPIRHHQKAFRTPESGLICNRMDVGYEERARSRHIPSHNAMDIDEEIDRPRPRVAPSHVRTEVPKASLPIKERIKRYENICTDFSPRNFEGPKSPRTRSAGDILKTKSTAPSKASGQHPRETKDRNVPSPPIQDKKTLIITDPKIEKAKKDLGKSRKMFLGMYEIQSVLGVGGGGTVYSGIRIADSKPIAIKRIMREKIKRWGKIHGRKVPQEIVLMLKVNGHKNVVRLLDWYECLDSFILILERPQNCIDLFDYIREVGRLNEEEAAFIFKQVVEAVKHIHSRGVLHRDIKDENVIINRNTKKSKIIDFGCGTNLSEDVYKDFSGTPEFYPPEWFAKKEYRGRTAATWSLGVLLYDMLCGEIPFKTRRKIVENTLIFKVPISQEGRHLIAWMLSGDANVRPNLEEILQHPWLR